MTETIKKKRIFQIAKELNISHLEIIKFLENKGQTVQSHMSPVNSEMYDDILMEFSKDKEQSDRYRKEQARKKVVSNIRKHNAEEALENEKPIVKKIQTRLSDHALSLSERLKSASKVLEKEKKEKIQDDNKIDNTSVVNGQASKVGLKIDEGINKDSLADNNSEKLNKLSIELKEQKTKIPPKPRSD